MRSPLNKGRLDQAAVWAGGAKYLKEEDGPWMTLTKRADLWRCLIQPRVVTPHTRKAALQDEA